MREIETPTPENQTIALPDHRVIAIGDIHGCSTALAAVLAAVRPGPADLVIPLGDVIDYGPDSRGVLEQLKALRDRARVVLLTGNHEEMLFGVLDLGRDPDSWIRHGDDQTLASYGVDHPRELPADDLALLRTAKPYFETAIRPVPGLFTEDAPAPDGILLSHAHLDHVGLLHYSRPEIPV